MPGIFSRIVDIIQANINDMLDRAEDPEKMLKQMIIEMEEAVAKTTTAVAKAMANEKSLEQQYERHRRSAQEWEQKAVQALQNGREDLARQALERKQAFERSAQDLEKTLLEARQATTQLRSQLEKLKSRLEEARTRYTTLSARAQAARTRKELAQALSGVGGDAFSKFERYEKKILQQEAEAQAAAELAGESPLEEEFARMETQSAVDEELARLKAKLQAQGGG
ncbi:MAG: PspA/IM30 family protein [Acidobacteria bacterium]|nr:PspA/IM30 family protein [Acidobacteriota bacterium]MDW7985396.1 PspA/IM30 family protein [Acidobacteriota bacterium]